MIKELEHFSYEDRLTELALFNLEMIKRSSYQCVLTAEWRVYRRQSGALFIGSQ